jgi:hypothetical protein
MTKGKNINKSGWADRREKNETAGPRIAPPRLPYRPTGHLLFFPANIYSYSYPHRSAHLSVPLLTYLYMLPTLIYA